MEESSDAVIVKYDNEGTIEWNKNFGGSYWLGYEEFTSIIQVVDGGYIVTGFSASNDGDLAGLNKGDTDAIIVKYDKTGKVEWNKNFGGAYIDRFYSVDKATGGGFVAVGTTGSKDGDLVGLGVKGWEGLIAKFDDDGGVEWVQNYYWPYINEFFSVSQTTDGGYVAGGMRNCFFTDMIEDCSASIVKYHDMSEPAGVTTSDISTPTCGPATVTLTTNVPIETPKGWTKVNSRKFTKEYAENKTETLTLVGLNGLTGTVQIVVDNIIIAGTPLAPSAGEGLIDCREKKAPDAGRNLVLGMVVLGEVMFVVIGVAVFFRVREV